MSLDLITIFPILINAVAILARMPIIYYDLPVQSKFILVLSLQPVFQFVSISNL